MSVQKCYGQFVDYQKVINCDKTSEKNNDELHVMLMESAFFTEKYGIARDVVESYFAMSPQKNQFFCRAKIMMALIVDYESRNCNGNESIKQHRLAAAYVMEALDIALEPNNLPRYQFLVFNASAALWKIVHQFFRAGRAKVFAVALERVAIALEQQEDADKDWRIMYLTGAALCYNDDGQVPKCTELLDKAIGHMESILTATEQKEQKLSQEALGFTAELDKIMSAFRAIEARQELLSKPKRIDPDEPEDASDENPETQNLPQLEGLAAEGYDKVKSLLDDSQRRKSQADTNLRELLDIKMQQQKRLNKLYMQRIHYNQNDSKRFSGQPQILKDLRTNTLVQLQCCQSGCIPEKDLDPLFESLIKKLDESSASNTRTETLLDVCRTCWYLGKRDAALKCWSIVSASTAISPMIRIKTDFCQALQQISDLNVTNMNMIANQRLSTRQVEGLKANKTIEAIKLMERTLLMCSARGSDRSLEEEVAVVLWNNCIPFLQTHLRLKVFPCIKSAAASLDSMSSSLLALRSQIHLELAKCEEQSDFVGIAKEEATKAFLSDYGSLQHPALKDHVPHTGEPTPSIDFDRNRLMDVRIAPFLELLDLRTNVYDSPEDLDSKIILLLQQAKESKSKSFVEETTRNCLYLMLEELRIESEGRDWGSLGSDISIALMRKGPIIVEEKPLGDIKNLLESYDNPEAAYATFSDVTQRRTSIMFTIVQLSHASRDVNLLLHAASYVLSTRWNPTDELVRGLIDLQIATCNFLADGLLEKLSQIPQLELDQDANKSVDETKQAQQHDPRSLGIISSLATEEMITLKSLVVRSLFVGASLGKSVADPYAMQNAIIYFWNMHIHIFRKQLYQDVSHEVLNFLKFAVQMLDAIQPPKPIKGLPTEVVVDDRLLVAVSEGLIDIYEAKNDLTLAIEVATKAANGKGSEYMRRKLCERLSMLTIKASTAGLAGGKGGKSGAGDPAKFDSVLLNVYACIAQAECQITSSKEAGATLVAKAIAAMDGEVSTFLSQLAWIEMTQERYSQLFEMQAECWTRLTRLQTVLQDTVGSQYTAEKCLALISNNNISPDDLAILSPRFWRWLSVCERLYGIAIMNILQSEGQDEDLQNELRLAALTHFSVAASYGRKAQLDELVIDAVTNAWNSIIPLVDVAALRGRLFELQTKIVRGLNGCDGANSKVMTLRQQLYMSMIEGFANVFDWDNAMKMVLEAFQFVSSDFQKPLWIWRVIAMSKKGKNVLDGLQKLKENDPSLQAQVYAILARSSNNAKLQLESYMKIIDILQDSMERVDYLLEIAQWMASTGLPKMDVNEMIELALDALYEVQEREDPGLVVDEEDDAGSVGEISVRDSTTSRTRTRRGSKTNSDIGSASQRSRSGVSVKGAQVSRQNKLTGNVSRSVTARGGSVTGSKTKLSNINEAEEVTVPAKLDQKLIEQLIRSLCMSALIEADYQAKMNKVLECVYFVEKGISLFYTSLANLHKKKEYASLSDDVKANTDLDSFSPSMPDYLTSPLDDSILQLNWSASDEIKELVAIATSQGSADIPSHLTHTTVPLTVHYLIRLIDELHRFGYTKHAFKVVLWLRMVLELTEPHVEGREMVLVLLKLKVLVALYTIGLTEEAESLSLSIAVDGLPKIGEVLTVYVKSNFNTVKGSREAPDKMLSREGPFGFSTWTQNISRSDLNVTAILVSISENLVQLGQNSLAYCLTTATHKECNSSGDARIVIQCTTILAKLALQRGAYSEAVSILLCTKPLMSSSGDALLLAEQTELMVNACISLDKLDDAKNIVGSAMELTEEVTQVLIEKRQGKTSQTERPAMGAISGTASVKSLHSANSHARSAESLIQQNRYFESSSENVEAFVKLTSCYVDVITVEAKAMMVELQDVRRLYFEVCDRLSKCYDIVVDSVGVISAAAGVILRKQVTAPLSFLMYLHAFSSSSTVFEGYNQWMLNNIATCAENARKYQELMDILATQIPSSEQVYTSGTIEKRSISEINNGSTKEPYRKLSIPLVRDFAMSNLLLAETLIAKAMFSGLHCAIKPDEDVKILTVEEKYLLETQPPPLAEEKDFNIPILQRAITLASAAVDILDGTDFCFEGDLLYSCSQVMRMCSDGLFSNDWRRKRGDLVEVDYQRRQAIIARNTLEEKTSKRFQAHIGSLQSAIEYSCIALIESNGCVNDKNAASWVMRLQSLAARKALYKCWKDALNPLCEISCSLNRLEKLESLRLPNMEAIKLISAEKAYLFSTSVPYRR